MIPSGIFQIYYDVCDDILANDYLSNLYTIYYPPLKTVCTNCNTGHFGGVSKNVYKHGGPAPFTGQCPLCGGNGYSETENTATLRLRVYWSRKDWIKIANVNVAQAQVMIIGHKADLPKIHRMNEIELNGRYRLLTKPQSHGFGDKYFIAFLHEVN